VPHPDVRVRRVGFALDHPYVERCWAGMLGPSSVLVLRRLPELWAEAMPAEVGVDDFARSLGLGRSTGGWQSRIWRSFERLRRFQLATPVEGGTVGVFAQVPPVPERLLHRLPAWSRGEHDRLVAVHLEGLVGEPRGGLAHQVVTRLDDLHHRSQSQAIPGLSR
jgi:hypothetical protein